jgi:hypothetical protein
VSFIQLLFLYLISRRNGSFKILSEFSNSDYKVSMDLHIGVTSSRGKVFEFDRGGLHRDREKRWEQCLVIHQAREEQSLTDWDFTLNSIADQDCWTTARYVYVFFYFTASPGLPFFVSCSPQLLYSTPQNGSCVKALNFTKMNINFTSNTELLLLEKH